MINFANKSNSLPPKPNLPQRKKNIKYGKPNHHEAPRAPKKLDYFDFTNVREYQIIYYITNFKRSIVYKLVIHK